MNELLAVILSMLVSNANAASVGTPSGRPLLSQPTAVSQNSSAPSGFSASEALKSRICDAAQRVDQNQKRLDRQNAIKKEAGVADKEELYLAGRGVILGREEGKEAMTEFKKETGHDFTGDDLLKCDYFSP